MIFRALHPVDHYPWTDGQENGHGNRAGAVASTPVARKAIAIYPTGSQEPVSADYAARYVTRLTLLVEDPSVYRYRDEIEIAGTRYELDGEPADWRQGPFASVNALFGGELHLIRAAS